MSMQQGLGLLGGVVGAFFGYPQLGFVVGSLVGGLLTPAEKTEGPRVDDLKVQVSTYGAGLPIIYGTERFGGNVVWSTDKIEIATTEGGKGGGPENTTYRYYVHMGIVLCETPRDGAKVSIVQIYQDGKLIFDVHSGLPIASALASAQNPYAAFILYQGGPDQLPDPGEEAWMGGPGSVPAYRGVVRVRMNAIECPGGRVPQFSFVLTTTPSVSVSSYFAQIPDSAGIATSEEIWGWKTTVGSTRYMDVSRAAPGEPAQVIRRVLLGTPFVNFSDPFAVAGGDQPTVMYQLGVQESVGDEYDTICVVDLKTGAISEIDRRKYDGASTPPGRGSNLHAAFEQSSNRFAVTRGYNSATRGLTVLPTNIECDITNLNLSSPVAFYDRVVYVLSYPSGSPVLARIDADTGSAIDVFTGPPIFGLNLPHCTLQVDENGIYIHALVAGAGSRIYRVIISGATAAWLPMPGNADFVGDDGAGPFPASVCKMLSNCAIVGPNLEGTWTFVQYEVYNPVAVPVSEIIADQCERAGEMRYDLSTIPDTDTVMGYKLQNPASARSNIDPLLTAFAIYIVDEDGAIKFKKYSDITSVASVAYDELGQADIGSEAPDAMPLNRAQEIDLPRSVSVSYIEPMLDYQTASEKEVRQITEATEDVIIELPLATDSDHAKQVASMVLFARWRSQNTRNLKVSRKFAFLSPGDGTLIEYPRGTWRLWRWTSLTDTGVAIEGTVEPGDSELYAQTAVGATGYQSQDVAPLAPPTRLELLDIPILRDEDNNAGLYAAMAGYSPGWPGAELFVGDDDTTLQSRGTVTNESPMGVAEGALGAWTRNVIDETNLVTVNVGNHALSNITQDALLTGTQNVAALGAPGRWEVIKFQRAASLGSGRYILSGLMRGQRGTEWARALHQSGDTFVVLSIAGMLRPNLEAGSIGQVKRYRAVTKGRSLNSVASQSYANTAEGLETFSPTNLTKTVVAGGIQFDWVRRTRLSENWLAGIVPLGEVQERYDVVLYIDSTFTSIRRTISATTRSALYTTAMQAEDGYTTGALYVRLYQISDTVGRGHEHQATI